MSEIAMSRKPYVKIIEEPCSRGMRFRYDSEGRFAGSVAGVNSTPANKSYPTIQIMNHVGPTFVVVSCVTKDEPYRPHPHNIVGKVPEISQGICYFKTPENQSVISFPYIGIQCVKKKDIIKSLDERERLKVDPFKTGYDHKNIPEKLDLTCIRLCFQVFLEGQVKDVFNVPLDPVVSAPIYDKKAAAELAIWWISHYSAPVTGGSVICLLCDKVAKGDIQVRFYNDETQWEATAEFTPPKFHKQVAVIFKSPRYIVQDIDQPVRVFIQLRRPSDGEVSKSIPFEFIPAECALEDGFKIKRQKRHESPRDLVFRHLQQKADENANTNFNTNTFPIIKTEPWGLPSTTMYNPNIIEEPKHFTPYNQMNMYSETPSTNNNMISNFNHVYYNAQPMMQMMNSKNNYPNYNQQYPAIVNEQRNHQNSSYLDELLTSMIDQNLEVQ